MTPPSTRDSASPREPQCWGGWTLSGVLGVWGSSSCRLLPPRSTAVLGIAAGQWQQHQATAPVGRGSCARAAAQGLCSQVSLCPAGTLGLQASALRPLGLPSVGACFTRPGQEHRCTRLPGLSLPPFSGPTAPTRSSSVFMERELTLDGAIVSGVFHDSMDMGVVGTTAGTLWYVSWAEGTSTRLISGHRSKVRPPGH